MKKLIVFLSLAVFGASGAAASQPDPAESEASLILQAAWGAALILSDEKQSRLAPAFLEIAALSGETELLNYWESRLGQSYSADKNYRDYGWQIAEPVLRDGGIVALIERAKQRAAPLNVGRTDALLSAGKHYSVTDPRKAQQLNETLLDLTRNASEFEKPVLSHAAAELAMIRCDQELFGKSEMHTTAPGNLRYAFWRARMSGNAASLVERVRAIEIEDDTREVRRVLEGYRAVLEFGYCSNPDA